MSLRVIRAVALEGNPLSPYAAPVGFPFVVQESADRVEVVSPIAGYLFNEFCPVRLDQELMGITRATPQNSATAVANDLKDWWQYLAYVNRDWASADTESLLSYRDIMLSTMSPHTKRPYRKTTVRRRLASIIGFYKWASSNGMCGSAMKRELVDSGRRSLANVQLAHVAERRVQRDTTLPKTSSSKWDQVRVFTEEEYRSVAHALGPLPSKTRQTADCQFRLGVELALQIGMRIDEIVNLTVSQVRGLGPPTRYPLSVCYLRLTHTKGSEPRNVPVPLWLLSELIYYIDHHRKRALRDGGLPDHGLLLVNGLGAIQHVGQTLKAATLRSHFKLATISSGLTKEITRYDLQTGTPYTDVVAKFRFHDLRHTFAVWHYYALRACGVEEPWKRIQAILGHRFLSTTIDVYLKVAGDFEALVSDAMAARLASIAKSMRP